MMALFMDKKTFFARMRVHESKKEQERIARRNDEIGMWICICIAVGLLSALLIFGLYSDGVL
jgi:hypothetical protein